MTCQHCASRSVNERPDDANDAQLNRRDFLTRAGGLAALAVVSSCGDGVVSGGVPGKPTERLVITVADFPALGTVGALVQVGETFAAKRTGAGAFDAFYMVCTHAGCLTSITNAQRFDCPCHGSRFDGEGAVVNGPARQPLLRLATAYDPVTDLLTIN